MIKKVIFQAVISEKVKSLPHLVPLTVLVEVRHVFPPIFRMPGIYIDINNDPDKLLLNVYYIQFSAIM